MRATKTWVGIVFIIAALIAAYVLNWILIDVLRGLHIANSSVLGSQFRLSAVIAVSIAFILAFYLGVLNARAKVILKK